METLSKKIIYKIFNDNREDANIHKEVKYGCHERACNKFITNSAQTGNFSVGCSP